MTLPVKTITSVLKVRLAAILVIMSVSTFKTTVILYLYLYIQSNLFVTSSDQSFPYIKFWSFSSTCILKLNLSQITWILRYYHIKSSPPVFHTQYISCKILTIYDFHTLLCKSNAPSGFLTRYILCNIISPFQYHTQGLTIFHFVDRNIVFYNYVFFYKYSNLQFIYNLHSSNQF
jgi:hypothetical protein